MALVCKCALPSYFSRVVCSGLLIRAFELTGLCCGQPGAPNSMVQRLCLQVQASSAERSAADGGVLLGTYVVGYFDLYIIVLEMLYIMRVSDLFGFKFEL